MRAFRRLAVYLRPYWKWALLAPFFMMLEVAGDLLHPRLLQRVVDVGIARGDMQVVVNTALWMMVVAFAGIGAGTGCTVFAVKASQAFGADLRHALFARVQALSFANLDELESGALITRLTNDVTQVQEVVLILLRIMIRVPLLLLGSLVMAVLTSPRLALLFVPLIPLILVVLIIITRKMYPLFTEVQRRLDVVNSVLQENLSGVRVIKAFARTKHENARFGAANQRLAEMNISAARIGTTTLPLMSAALNVGMVAAIWFGGVGVVRGSLQVGQVIAFVNYLVQALFSLMMVSMLVVRLSRAEASGVRIAEILDANPRLVEPSEPVPLPVPEGRVEFTNVRFAYDEEEDHPVLKDISFAAEPGQTIAVLGATGSGKSSLVHLIPRFYDVSGGSVRIDGVDVRELDESTLRRTVGIALQESVLFSGTIRDNIRYGREDASEEEVVAAARAAQADTFIRRLPDGYDTEVGQRGVNLSGGQKQRLAIARALLVKPAVLILDDSTSAVDVETEAAIQKALAGDNTAQTRFIVAQRTSAAEGADLVLVLEDGELAAGGTHHSLLESSPLYREIYESQREGSAVDAG